jgi:hypothetical protein
MPKPTLGLRGKRYLSPQPISKKGNVLGFYMVIGEKQGIVLRRLVCMHVLLESCISFTKLKN